MSFFSRKPKSKPTRLYFATDVHGSERTYKKFLNAGKFYEANVLVMGGDITGKMLIPIIDEGNGNYRFGNQCDPVPIVSWPDIVVIVQVKRDADQGGNRIGQFFGQILGILG